MRPASVATAATRVDGLLAAGEAGDVAVVCAERCVTYGELRELVTRAARGLQELGVTRGERVAVFAEKSIETVVAIFAAAAAGAVFVPVNPLFKTAQLAALLRDCAASAVLTSARRSSVVREAVGDAPSVRIVALLDADAPEQPAAAGPRVVGWDAVLGAGSRAACPSSPEIDVDTDLAAILYTSGSTGGPKGVVLTHRNLIVGATSVAGYLEMTADDVVLSVLPLSFDAGLSQLTTTFAVGARVVLVNYVLPREVVTLCERHRVTALTCVPPLWMQLLSVTWPVAATASLRLFANTGGAMPAATLTALRSRFPAAAPYLMYGLTEAFRSTYLEPAEVDRRPGSIGRAIPNAEVLVVRPDGSRCAPGEHGELVHRGPLVSLGYWNDPERTAARFRPLPGAEGVVHPELAVWSGDTAYCDDDGYLYFVGRSDDMIKTSGYRVSPSEIEHAAYATGLVSEAVALGIADPRLGQHVELIVSPRSDAGQLTHEQLVRAMADSVPRYMLPQHTLVLDCLPRSLNGKFDRVQLSAMVRP